MFALVVIAGMACAASAEICGGSPFCLSNRLVSCAGGLPGCLCRFDDYAKRAAGGKLVVNTNFWLRGLDFTAVSPWNSCGGTLRAGTAISRRHVIFAKHFPLSPGTRIAFVGESGETTHYTIKAVREVASCDIMIGLLDWELTPDIHPAKTLPADGDRFFAPGVKWPVVTFDKRERAFLSEIAGVRDDETGVLYIVNRASRDGAWRPFGGRLAGGDSGNPAFMILDGQPILLYCLLGGGPGEGPYIHRHRAEVQRAMDALCPGYRLETYPDKK